MPDITNEMLYDLLISTQAELADAKKKIADLEARLGATQAEVSQLSSDLIIHKIESRMSPIEPSNVDDSIFEIPAEPIRRQKSDFKRPDGKIDIDAVLAQARAFLNRNKISPDSSVN